MASTGECIIAMLMQWAGLNGLLLDGRLRYALDTRQKESPKSSGLAV